MLGEWDVSPWACKGVLRAGFGCGCVQICRLIVPMKSVLAVSVRSIRTRSRSALSMGVVWLGWRGGLVGQSDAVGRWGEELEPFPFCVKLMHSALMWLVGMVWLGCLRGRFGGDCWWGVVVVNISRYCIGLYVWLAIGTGNWGFGGGDGGRGNGGRMGRAGWGVEVDLIGWGWLVGGWVWWWRWWWWWISSCCFLIFSSKPDHLPPPTTLSRIAHQYPPHHSIYTQINSTPLYKIDTNQNEAPHYHLHINLTTTTTTTTIMTNNLINQWQQNLSTPSTSGPGFNTDPVLVLYSVYYWHSGPNLPPTPDQ